MKFLKALFCQVFGHWYGPITYTYVMYGVADISTTCKRCKALCVGTIRARSQDQADYLYERCNKK